ncbi:hypothetical protein G8S49_06250 [Clostridium botulinum C]|uniref:Uncharacterized protein n=2 Tax=Clostridium botulinum TaxID=1491 RepID=A0A6G4D9R2_CLOBO|nr:hypothetical protein [Clostridium botulinum]MCD3194772.1 hypothetical protein [Clostridium botulinum C]MCD3200293.1 hypothetical protein [Clostridium botulinum C]MCD3205640.1 hypothetical protein [Clostridium botulinum C]MCD3207525.1 hypothetical protein [Clostridium botulinum C]MCD3226259.1 hypothetical protein [Clostridium botulinum C]
MAKSKVKKTGGSFVIEGILNYKDKTIEVEEMAEPFPFDKIFKEYDGEYIKLTVKESDEEILSVPEE